MAAEEPKLEPSTSIVPVDLDNIGTAAGIFGGILGLILFGPVPAVVLAAVAKYSSKKENDAGEALRGLGKTLIESYNYLVKINSKYDLTGKTATAVGDAVAKLPISDNESLDSVKKTITSTVEKVKELDKEIDFVSKGKQVLSAASTISDSALEKVEELNAKYDFVETTKKAATAAVGTIASKVNEIKRD